VLCVLAAVLFTAAFSLQSGFAGHSGGPIISDKPNLEGLGKRLHANTIAIVFDNPNVAARQTMTPAEGGPADGG
jgi:hypothetical protein